MAILQLSEAGELAYLQSKWWASSCIADKAKAAAAQPHGFKGMFVVLALGLTLGTLLAILELASRSRSSAAEQKVGSQHRRRILFLRVVRLKQGCPNVFVESTYRKMKDARATFQFFYFMKRAKTNPSSNFAIGFT